MSHRLNCSPNTIRKQILLVLSISPETRQRYILQAMVKMEAAAKTSTARIFCQVVPFQLLKDFLAVLIRLMMKISHTCTPMEGLSILHRKDTTAWVDMISSNPTTIFRQILFLSPKTLILQSILLMMMFFMSSTL